jgi:predicted MFS family arabinose efflux permease
MRADEHPAAGAPERSTRRRHPLTVLLVAMAVLAASNSVVFPLLPDLQDAHGLPTWGLGVISGSAFLVGLVVQLTVAGLADQGHARILLRVGLAVAVVSGLLFAAGSSLVVFVLARALGGVSVGCFVPAARAVAATTDPTRVAANLGLLASFELGGFVFGPVLGAILAGPLGLRWPFVLFAGAAALALAVSFTQPLPEYGSTGVSSRPSLDLLRIRGVVVAALLALALFLPVGIYDALWAKYLDDRGASTLFIGTSLALYGIPFVLLAPLGGRLADRHGPVRAALAMLVLVAPITALYGSLRLPVVIALLALVEAVFQAVAVPAAQAAMAAAAPKDRVAAGQGLAGATQLLGAATMAFVAAPLYDAAGPEVVFGLAGTLIAVLGLVAWRLHRSIVLAPATV